MFDFNTAEEQRDFDVIPEVGHGQVTILVELPPLFVGKSHHKIPFIHGLDLLV